MVPKTGHICRTRNRGVGSVIGEGALLVIVFSTSAVVSVVCVAALIPLLRKRVVDKPNERSSHSAPTPRGGGLGLIVGVAAGLLAATWAGLGVGPGWFWACVGVVALFGLADDASGGLSPSLRLVAQLVVASVAVVASGPLPRVPLPPPLDFRLGVFGYFVGVIWIVGVINIYNFLDGIDGYAAVQGIVAGLGAALILGGHTLPIGVCIAGACAGFLVFNWHPAKVFLGDVGSGFIGAALALLPFVTPSEDHRKPVFVVAMCLWFFLSDGTFTIIRRAARGERLWQAHRSHLYQRLVCAGWPHDRVVLLALPCMIAVVVSTWLVLGESGAGLRFGVAWLPVLTGVLLTAGMWGLTVVRERASYRTDG